jgi:hypothetical protein
MIRKHADRSLLRLGRRCPSFLTNRLICIGLFSLTLALPLQAIAATATSTTLTLSSANVAPGTAVTLTASVADSSSNPVTKGQVIFCNSAAVYCEDAAIVGTAQLISNGCALVKIRPGLGSQSFKAMFVGTTVDSPRSPAGFA